MPLIFQIGSGLNIQISYWLLNKPCSVRRMIKEAVNNRFMTSPADEPIADVLHKLLSICRLALPGGHLGNRNLFDNPGRWIWNTINQSINFNFNFWTTANIRLHETRFIWRLRYFYCDDEIYYIFCLAKVRHYIPSYLLLELFYDKNYFIQINKLKVYTCQIFYKDD